MIEDPSFDPSKPKPKKPKNRLAILLILVIAVFACGACGLFFLFIVDNDAAPVAERTAEVEPLDLTEESSEVLIAEPTDESIAEAAPTDTPVPTKNPKSEIDMTVYITGNNITPDDLPQGETGLTVALAGPPSNFGVIPVIIRNNTDEPVYDIQISATARDDAGSVVGTARGDDIVPSYIPPAGLAIGRVLFGDTPSMEPPSNTW